MAAVKPKPKREPAPAGKRFSPTIPPLDIPAEDALRRSEDRFRGLLEAAPDAILEVDSEGKIVTLNQAAERMFGYQRDELLGKRVEHLVPESARAAHVRGRGSYAEQPVRRPMGIGLDLKAQKKDGSLFPVEISLSPNWTSGERSVIAIVRDMTEHRRMQDAVRLSEERLRQAQKLEALASTVPAKQHWRLAITA